MSTSDESERRVAEALRARAAGAPGMPSPLMAGPGPSRPLPRQAPHSGTSIRTALLIALLGGAVLGSALALLSLLAPGVLPALG
ncbi:hypothetical protein GCM10009609_13430 [Pseudonocardia aurantiaca]|uniref:Uncharacterized protein n=1 Tax=Pseudonocardia aurantiaca TaxID=75290 RepID=A0ABW4FF35_9PSEU